MPSRTIRRSAPVCPPAPAWRRAARRWLEPEQVLAVAIALHVTYFSVLLVLRQRRFATYDYDLGIFDQAVWLLSRGDSFVTLRGLDFWGHHVEPAMLLFVPAYWLGAGATTLNVAMVLSLALGARPVFRLAERHIGDGRIALVLAVVYLAHYSTQWILQETFHPEVMAVAPLLAAWLAAEERRWSACAAWIVFAVAWKEDVSMATAMFGLVLALRGQRRAGAILFGCSVAWFLFATEVILPTFGHGGPFYGALYGDLGATPIDVAATTVVDPGQVVGVYRRNHGFGDLRDLLAPYGFTSLRSPLALLMAVPQSLASHLTITELSTGNRVHYVAMPLVAATISMVEGVGRFRPSRQPWVVGLVAACCLATSSAWGTTPVSVTFDEAIWWRSPNPRQRLLEEAVAMVPDEASISASYSFAPQLAHRHQLFRFPNPWRSTNWAVDPADLPDPSTIEWLVLDRRHLSDDEERELAQIVANGAWMVELDEADVFVARRAGAQSPGARSSSSSG